MASKFCGRSFMKYFSAFLKFHSCVDWTPVHVLSQESGMQADQSKVLLIHYNDGANSIVHWCYWSIAVSGRTRVQGSYRRRITSVRVPSINAWGCSGIWATLQKRVPWSNFVRVYVNDRVFDFSGIYATLQKMRGYKENIMRGKTSF